jgi:hypothetical protein
LLLTQTGDETLDFREGTAHFHASPAIIEYGGDHAFQNAERHFPFMLQFLQNLFLNSAARPFVLGNNSFADIHQSCHASIFSLPASACFCKDESGCLLKVSQGAFQAQEQ